MNYTRQEGQTYKILCIQTIRCNRQERNFWSIWCSTKNIFFILAKISLCFSCLTKDVPRILQNSGSTYVILVILICFFFYFSLLSNSYPTVNHPNQTWNKGIWTCLLMFFCLCLLLSAKDTSKSINRYVAFIPNNN